MGCFNPNTSQADSCDKMEQAYKRIYLMRRKLLDHILQCRDPVEIAAMGAQLCGPVKMLLEELCSFYRHTLEKGRDFNTVAFQNECTATQQLLEQLANQAHLLSVFKELIPLTEEFHVLASEVNKLKLSEECRHKVLGLIRLPASK
jgi:hypothetical protein